MERDFSYPSTSASKKSVIEIRKNFVLLDKKASKDVEDRSIDTLSDPPQERRNDRRKLVARRRSYKTCYIKIRTKERRKFTPKNYTTYYTYTIQSFTLKFFFFLFFKTSLREDRADRPTRNAIFFFFFLLFARAIRQSMAAFIPYVCPTTTRLNTFFLILLAPSARPAARGTSAIVAVAASRDCSTDEADRDPI